MDAFEDIDPRLLAEANATAPAPVPAPVPSPPPSRSPSLYLSPSPPPVAARRVYAKPKGKFAIKARPQAADQAQAQAPAPAPLPTPAPLPAPAPVAPAPLAAVSSKGKGKEKAKPEFDPEDCQYLILPLDQVRNVCERLLAGCASFMSGPPLSLPQSWIGSWHQSTLNRLNSEPELKGNGEDFLHDQTVDFVGRFFAFNLRRRIDGPDDAGKNVVLAHLTELCKEEGIDLGLVVV